MMRSILPGRYGSGYGQRASRCGFTLVEVLICAAIVGLSVVALMESVTTSTRQNAYTIRRNYAILLASNAYEYTARLPYWDPQAGTKAYGPSADETTSSAYDNVLDFTTETAFSPPIDASGVQIDQPGVRSDAYTQFISITPVNVNDLKTSLPAPSPQSDSTYAVAAVRVQVRIMYRPDPTGPATELYRAQWIRCDD